MVFRVVSYVCVIVNSNQFVASLQVYDENDMRRARFIGRQKEASKSFYYNLVFGPSILLAICCLTLLLSFLVG